MTPGDLDRRVELANVKVRIARVSRLLSGSSAPQAKADLNFLKNAAANKNASPMILECVVSAFLRAEPAALKDPKFAVATAERGAALTHRKTPQWLIYLAESYSAIGEKDKAREVAKEGLSLLPSVVPGSPKSRIRKLLELAAADPEHAFE